MKPFNHYIEAWKRYAEFHGTTSRQAFWYFALFHIIIFALLALIEGGTEEGVLSGVFSISSGVPAFASIGDGLLSTIYSLATIVPSFAIGARRLHDTGKSGWWQLAILFPFFGAILLIILFAQPAVKGKNEFAK
jgi:uncharacterized membrane protein YhaH (DUF805 family)